MFFHKEIVNHSSKFSSVPCGVLTRWKILRFHIHPVVQQEDDKHSHCDVQNHREFSFSARRKSLHSHLPVKDKNLHLNVSTNCLLGREPCPIRISSTDTDRPIQTLVCIIYESANVTKPPCKHAIYLHVIIVDMARHEIAYLCY
jgi:hypothetical protein